MKKVTILLSVFALVAGLSQCRKPVLSKYESEYQKQLITFSTSDGVGQKGYFDNNVINKIVYHWNENKDKIYVYATTNAYSADGTTNFSNNSYFCGVLNDIVIANPGENTKATFCGSVNIPNGTKALRFIHYGEDINVASTGEHKGEASVNFACQTGNLTDVSRNLIAYCDREYTGCEYTDCNLEMAFALLKLSFDDFESDIVTLKTQGNTQLNVSSGGAISYSTVGEMTFSISGKGDYYTVMMPREIAEYIFKSTNGLEDVISATIGMGAF